MYHDCKLLQEIINIFLFFKYMIYSLTLSHYRIYLILPHVDKWTSSRTAICYTRNYLLSRRDHHVSFSRYKFVEIVRGKSWQLLWFITIIANQINVCQSQKLYCGTSGTSPLPPKLMKNLHCMILQQLVLKKYFSTGTLFGGDIDL